MTLTCLQKSNFLRKRWHKLRYKKNIPESEAEYLAKELVECAGISASLDQRMEAIRDRMEAAQEKIS